MKKKMRRFLPKRVFNRYTLIGVVVLVLAIWFFIPKPKTTPLEYASVKKGSIKSTVSTSGVLTGKSTATLKFRSSGKLAAVGIKVGDEVKTGQQIAYLDTQDLSIALQQAFNDYRAKDAAAKKAEDDVKDHASDETFAQKQTRTTAQAARDSAYDSMKAAQLAFQNAAITTPIGGTVIQAPFLPGQFISPADTIAQIVDFSAPYFDADVDEADIGKVALDQRVEVTLNAYENRVFPGKVSEILPQTKTTTSGATVVTVRVLLVDPNINLIANLNGQADIVTAEKNNVLLIPQEALKDDGTILTNDGKNIKIIKVNTGLRSDTEIEVLDILPEGLQVVTNPSAYKK